jgi:hypothetical protein
MVFTGQVGLLVSLVVATTAAGPVPQRPMNESTIAPGNGRGSNEAHLIPTFALDAGLAGPPLVADDGSWWVPGRDGQLAHLGANDMLQWAIGLGASIRAGATLGEGGLLFVPTAKNSIVAMEPRGTPRWRSRAPWGIDGPLAWVPSQGLAFVSQDQHLQWLGVNARLLQRARLPARRSTGPAALGNSLVIGTESGDLLVWETRNRRVHLDLSRPVRAIIGTSSERFLALAGKDLYAIAASAISWHRADVVAAGVATISAPGSGSRAQPFTVLAYSRGSIEWLDEQGRVVGSCRVPWPESADLVPEIAASPQCAWIASNAGSLWQCCHDGRVSELRLTRAALQRPVPDWAHQRLLVGSSEREIWSIPLLLADIAVESGPQRDDQ